MPSSSRAAASRCSGPRRSWPPGIPVMGHIGLTPQTATMLGGHKAQGRQWQQAKALYDSAIALEAAGCFAIVLECVPEPVAAAISRRLAIPTIGIGSGAATDGQVLVLHDLLDIHPDSGQLPRFIKQYAHIGAAMRDGVEAYASEVRARAFPAPEHTYPIAPTSSRPSRRRSPRRVRRTTTSSPTGEYDPRHDHLPSHHGADHRSREEPRVLRGARLRGRPGAADRPKRRARGDQLLLRPARPARRARADAEPRRPQRTTWAPATATSPSASPTSTPRSSS